LYLELALVGDTTSLTVTGIDYLETSIPGFTARAGNVETIMIEGAGQIAGELLEQATIVPSEAFAALGTSVFGIPMLDGQQATTAAVVTWAADTPATSLPADSLVGVPNADGNMYVFATDEPLIAPNGGGVQNVLLIARDVGVAMNNSFGACQMIDEVEGIQSIVAEGAIGGSDPETAEDYLDRLTTLIALLAPRPILPEDHAAMASTVPGVGRVSVKNLYYPGTTARDNGLAVGDYDKWTPQPPPAGALSGQARCTTVAIMGEGGADPDPALMNAVYTLLDANREVNFLNFVMKPQYVSVDVRATVTPYPNRTKTDAINGSTQMVEDWLSPDGFGLIPGSGSEEGWASDDRVRLYEAVDFLNRGTATWYVESVQLKLSSAAASAWAAADLMLPGVFPIPVYGEIQLT
jgi:hypothetical protein